MNENKLAEYFNLYYDGLMGIDKHNAMDTTRMNQLDQTICLFIKTESGFKGKMRVFDNFFSKDYLFLNIDVKEHFCEKKNKQTIYCDISPNDFDQDIWKIFEEVSLIDKCR